MKEGVTYGYVFLDMVPVGTYALSDTCRIGAAEAIKELKSLGIKTAMLTGDSTEASLHAQRQVFTLLPLPSLLQKSCENMFWYHS